MTANPASCAAVGSRCRIIIEAAAVATMGNQPRLYVVAASMMVVVREGDSQQMIAGSIQITTGLSKTCVQRWITRLHQERVIRISKWVKPAPESRSTAFYRIGSAPDAICRIEPLTNTQKVSRWRRRLKQRDPEAYELLMKKSIARIYAHKARTGRHDPLMAALYGQPVINTNRE